MAILQLSSTPVLARPLHFWGRGLGLFCRGRIRPRSLVGSTISSSKPHGKIISSTLSIRIVCFWDSLSKLTLSMDVQALSGN